MLDGLVKIIMTKTMLKSYIVSVLDHCDSEVDIFQVFVPELENEDDVREFLEEEVEEHGHHLSDSSWMFSNPNQFKFKVDL